MRLRDRLIERGRRFAGGSLVMRLLGNDGVMRVASGVMDARARLAAAGAILLDGHARHAPPPGAPALDASSSASRPSLSGIGGRDVFEKCFKFTTADNARAMGVYPFFRPL